LVGGLFFSQFVTLYTTPAVYLAIDKLRRRPEVAATAAPDGAGFA
jgi:multidrug efflux pump